MTRGVRARARARIAIAALTGLTLLASGPALAQDAPQKPRQVDLSGDFVSLNPLARELVLTFDTSRLPRAEPGRWKDFDPARMEDRKLRAYYRSAQDAITRGDWFGALQHLLRVLSGHPDHPPALHMSAMVYFRLQRYGDAARLMQRYVEVAPARVGDTRVLGHALYSLGRYDEACAHYEIVLRAAPDDVEARHGFALATWRAGDETRALAELDKVLARAPEHHESLAWKAQILFERGDREPALAALRRAVELAPAEPRSWFLLARLESEAGRDAEARAAQAQFEATSARLAAVRVAERRAALFPLDAGAFVELVRRRLELGDRERLQESARHARAFPVADARVWRVAIELGLSLGRASDAAWAAGRLAEVAGDDVADWKLLLAHGRAAGDTRIVDRATARLATLESR